MDGGSHETMCDSQTVHSLSITIFSIISMNVDDLVVQISKYIAFNINYVECLCGFV